MYMQAILHDEHHAIPHLLMFRHEEWHLFTYLDASLTNVVYMLLQDYFYHAVHHLHIREKLNVSLYVLDEGLWANQFDCAIVVTILGFITMDMHLQ